jgi:predicted component of viral defense system (DUF524 family)
MMGSEQGSELLIFSDVPEGRSIALCIYPPMGELLALQRLEPVEAAEYGEEQLQLLEGVRYEYELSAPNYRLVEENGTGVVKQSANPRLGHCGTLVTGLHTGKLILQALDLHGVRVGTAALEIRPRKLGHRDHYRKMLEEITDVCIGLAMDFRSPTTLHFAPSPGDASQTIHQRFAFLKAMINSRSFQDALHRISTHPHRKWEAEYDGIDVRRGFRPNGRTMRAIAKEPRRLALPTAHPLASSLLSLPERISHFRNAQTEDTKENQFVKFALETFASFLSAMQQKLELLAAGRVYRGHKKSEADARLQTQISSLENSLLHFLNADIFRNLSKLDILPLGSPVLQRKEGYREVLQAWLKFDMAARLIWTGGEDVFGAGRRNIAILYEYWVFFKLLSIVAEYFRFTAPPSGMLIEETADGFGLKLKSGEQLAFDAIYDTGSRRLRVQFGYNRTFGGNAEREVSGSWTEKMRPDYTLSLWPCQTDSHGVESLSADEAERQDLMVHVHFDAKYRVDGLEEIFGKENATAETAEGKYKRDDLLKMHSYRDAIRRTHGAYVIYPGDAEKGWGEYREILPGLGAFPLRPGNGDEALRRFIDDVVRHVCDRTTHREQLSFHTFRIHNQSKASSIFARFSEVDKFTRQRLLPLADTHVLIAPSYSDLHFDFAVKTGLFALVLSTARSAIDPLYWAAKFLLICSPGLPSRTAFVQVQANRPKILSGRSLITLGVLDAVADANYLVFEIEDPSILIGTAWQVERVGSPEITTLDIAISRYAGF